MTYTPSKAAIKPDEAETRLLIRRGWRPVLRDHVVDYLRHGRGYIPVVESVDIVAWTHRKLSFPWPTEEALRLEAERSRSRPRVLKLFGQTKGPAHER